MFVEHGGAGRHSYTTEARLLATIGVKSCIEGPRSFRRDKDEDKRVWVIFTYVLDSWELSGGRLLSKRDQWRGFVSRHWQ